MNFSPFRLMRHNFNVCTCPQAGWKLVEEQV